MIAVVVGMKREAEIVGRRARVLVGAASLDQALRDGASGVMSFGLCGALDPDFRVGDLVIGTRVVGGDSDYQTDEAWTATLARALLGARQSEFAAADAIVGSAKAKAALRATTGAGAVDMESHLAANGAAEFRVPFAIVRAVSDTAYRDLPRSAQAGFGVGGETDVAAVLLALLRRPWEAPALIATAGDAGRALRALARASATVSWEV